MKKLWRSIRIPVCLMLAAGLVACGGNSGGSVVLAGSETSCDSDAPAETVISVPATASALEGDWTTGCFPFDRTANTQSALLTLSISGTSSVYTAYSYSDFNCSVPAISPDTGAVIVNGNEDFLEFPEESVSTSLGEASFINFTTVSITVDSMPVPSEFVEPTTLYSIYRITDDGRLYFGNGASTSLEARPLTLDVFFYYIRL